MCLCVRWRVSLESKQIGNSLNRPRRIILSVSRECQVGGRARRYCVRVLDMEKCLLCNVYILLSSSNLVAESSVTYRRVVICNNTSTQMEKISTFSVWGTWLGTPGLVKWPGPLSTDFPSTWPGDSSSVVMGRLWKCVFLPATAQFLVQLKHLSLSSSSCHATHTHTCMRSLCMCVCYVTVFGVQVEDQWRDLVKYIVFVSVGRGPPLFNNRNQCSKLCEILYIII